MLGKLDSYLWKNEIRTLPNTIHVHVCARAHTHTHNWIKDSSVSPETIKLLEENIGSTHSDTNLNKILSHPPPRLMEILTVFFSCNCFVW